MPKNAADAFITAVKERGHFARDEDLADRFGWTKAAVSNWRQRGRIPNDKIRLLEEQFSVSFDDVANRHTNETDDIGIACDLSFLSAFRRCCDKLDDTDMNTLCVNASISMPAIRAALKTRILRDYAPHKGAVGQMQLFNKSINGEYLSADDLLRWIGPGKPPSVPANHEDV